VIPAAVSASRTDDTMAADRCQDPNTDVMTGTAADCTAVEMMDLTAL